MERNQPKITHAEIFDSTIQKTNLLLKEIEDCYGWEGRRNQSYAALRIVLQTLRDRLPVKEAVHLGAQLPMLVRGFYYEGWDPEDVPRKMHKEDFLNEVRTRFQFSLETENIGELVRNVLSALKKHVSEGEWRDIQDVLPKDIAELLAAVRK